MTDLFDLIEKRHFLTYNDCYMGREEMLAYLVENHIKYDIESTYELDLQCVFVCINKHSRIQILFYGDTVSNIFLEMYDTFYFFKDHKVRNNGIDAFIKELEKCKIEWRFKETMSDKIILLEVGTLVFHFNYDVCSYLYKISYKE